MCCLLVACAVTIGLGAAVAARAAVLQIHMHVRMRICSLACLLVGTCRSAAHWAELVAEPVHISNAYSKGPMHVTECWCSASFPLRAAGGHCLTLQHQHHQPKSPLCIACLCLPSSWLGIAELKCRRVPELLYIWCTLSLMLSQVVQRCEAWRNFCEVSTPRCPCQPCISHLTRHDVSNIPCKSTTYLYNASSP